MLIYTHEDHSKGGTVEELTALKQRNVDTILDILKELWSEVKINNIHMETHSISSGFKKHFHFIKSIIKYRERPSSLNATDILKY